MLRTSHVGSLAQRPTQDSSHALILFWDVYQKHYEAIATEVLADAAHHAEFGPIVAALVPEVAQQQDEENKRLIDAAIRHDRWAPYAAYLRSQGADYARAGISLASWIELVAAFSTHLRPYLLEAYTDSSSELLASLTGMSQFTNFAVAAIAEGYRDAERELVLNEERERQRADRAVAESLQRLESMQLAAEALLDVSRHIEVSTDLPTLFGRLSATIAELVQADRVLFARVQEDGSLAAEPDAYGISPHVLSRLRGSPCDPGGQDLAGLIAYHDLVFRSPSGRGDLFALDSRPPDAFAASSAIAVAWRSGDRRLGILSAYDSRRPNGFTDDDTWVLRIAALAAGLVWQHKQAEERERAAWRQERDLRARLQATIDSALNAIITMDARGVITEWNTQAETTFGWTRDEAIGRAVADTIVPPQHRDAHLRGLERFQSTGEGPVLGQIVEITALHRDGREFPVELAISPTSGAAEGVTFVAFARDITDRWTAAREIHRLNQDLQQRVAQLQAVNGELEAFTYTVSHDLRAPLRAIDGFSRILLTDHAPALDEGGRACLERVRRGAQQMGHLIDDLLTFSRLGRLPLNRRTILPSEIARRALEDLAGDQDGRCVEVHVADLPACTADPVLLEQVFVNLLANALKFTRRRSEALVEVGWRENADEPDVPVYFVRDNGVGFDMQYADRLFGVFQRLHRAEEYEGTGVGLAIVQRIVARHGGRVWAEAEPDHGTTIHFTLGGEDPHD